MRKAILFFLLFSLTTAPILADEDDHLLDLALKNYAGTHYRHAFRYFERLKGVKMKDEKAKIARYALEIMEKHKDYLYGIEKEEISLRKKMLDAPGVEALRPALSVERAGLRAKHRAFARNLMEKEFYIKIVEPHLKRVAALGPDDPSAYVELGNAYYASMQYAKAVKCYEKSISLNPGYLYVYKMAGDSCIAVGNYDAAKKFYSDLLTANDKALLRYDPSEIEKIRSIIRVLPETYKDIDVLLKDGRYDEAEAILKKRISMNSADFIAMTALASIYQEAGDRKTAMKLLTNAVSIEPDYPIAHLYLGRLYFLMRRFDEAISELVLFKEKINRLPKMDEETKKMYVGDLYYLSEVYFTLERYEDARKELEEILKLDPNQQAAYHDMGVYYYVHERNRSKAYQHFKKSIELDPSTETAKRCEYNIEFMRNNPDPRMTPDFSFIEQEFRK